MSTLMFLLCDLRTGEKCKDRQKKREIERERDKKNINQQ